MVSGKKHGKKIILAKNIQSCLSKKFEKKQFGCSLPCCQDLWAMRVGAVKRVGEVDGRVEGGRPLASSWAKRREPDPACNMGGTCVLAVEGRVVLLVVVVSARSATASSMSASVWRVV